LKTYNADQKSKALIERIEKLANYRLSVNILLPIGCTHQWANAKYEFDQIDKLLAFVNKKLRDQKRDITLSYSTASEFTKALREENLKLPVTYDDL
jgi:hypothetical protein